MTNAKQIVRSDQSISGTIAVATFAMTVGWFLQGALSVIATYVTDDLRLTKAELGLLFFSLSIAGAFAAPLTGKWADRSITHTLELLYGFAAAGLVMVAVSGNLFWAIASVLVGAIGLGASNPVSNKLVMEGVPQRRRGLAIGIKQSGPFISVIVAGLVLPATADWIGWRWAVAAVAAVPLLALVTSLTRRRRYQLGRTSESKEEEGGREVGADVWWLAGAGLLVAVGTGICVAFIPLYAKEGLGYSPSVAGLVASLFGLCGAAGRVVWSVAAGRRTDPAGWLIPLAASGGGAAGLLLASRDAPALIWLGVVIGGASILSWHAVAWLTLLNHAHRSRIGRASAVLHTANLIGAASGPLVAGWLTDYTGGYDAAWGLVVILFAAAGLVVTVWRRVGRRNTA